MIDDLLDMITDAPGQIILVVLVPLVFAYQGIKHCSNATIDRPQNNKPAWCEPANLESKTYATGYEGKEYLNKTKGPYCESGTNEHNRKDKDSELLMCIYEEYLTK